VTRNAAGVERVLPGATRIGPAHRDPGPRKETEGPRMREADRKGNRFDAGFRRLCSITASSVHMICYLWC
jgi:hypothetical protein